MAAPFAIPVVLEAMRAALAADSLLADMLEEWPTGLGTGPAIYSEGGVAPGAQFPYLTIGAATERPFNSMGDGGSDCTVQVKAFSRKMADDEAYEIMTRVQEVLDAEDITVEGYGSACCEFDFGPALFVENVAGVGSVRQLPRIFRVYVRES